MKKLLLVLMVVAMASFLFVGCLPGTTTPPPEEPPVEPPVEPTPVTIAVDKQYTNPTTGVTYVKCSDKVIVTFPEAVAPEYIVKVAEKVENVGVITYEDEMVATPDTTRKIWTVTYSFVADECEAICLVAIKKHPCCPGEEVALRVVTVDCTAPVVDLTLTFKDCADPCVTPDICDPVIGGAYFEFTSIVTGGTECVPTTTDNCTDACSGVGAWSFVVDKGECDECPVITGTGCPVKGVADCGCLPYATATQVTVTYVLSFDVKDKVGNAADTQTWTIIVDTDETVSVDGVAL